MPSPKKPKVVPSRATNPKHRWEGAGLTDIVYLGPYLSRYQGDLDLYITGPYQNWGNRKKHFVAVGHDMYVGSSDIFTVIHYIVEAHIMQLITKFERGSYNPGTTESDGDSRAIHVDIFHVLSEIRRRCYERGILKDTRKKVSHV